MQTSLQSGSRSLRAFMRNTGKYSQWILRILGKPQSFRWKLILGIIHQLVTYLDDILVFSKSIEEHFQHCEVIFKRLKKYKLKLSYEKCVFLKSQVQYLGHLLSGAGIEPVPEKLQALKEMAEPSCAKGVKIYLGFVGYYRKFIPKYSDRAKPLTE